ncbi:hypothetical protein [Arenimonas daejeonensis]|uniref:hypothetical protein n=1 Tax=Arenimonas daejeonensis TaxID=370777 RepID=UPI001D140083|nr:hypothetical protein [Arenimonas daejeonensis]
MSLRPLSLAIILTLGSGLMACQPAPRHRKHLPKHRLPRNRRTTSPPKWRPTPRCR